MDQATKFINEEHPVQKYQVLYFQLNTTCKIYFAKYFSARAIICTQFLHHNITAD
jgi:hypothetical protein